MRLLVPLALACISLGCATTVTRLDGTVETSAGPAKTLCEKKHWLVLAPTQRKEVEKRSNEATSFDDGLGLYKVGGNDPESIPAHAEDLKPSPVVADHTKAVRPYDNRRIAAAIVGTTGILAIGIGTGLFISAFDEKTVIDAMGNRQRKQEVDGTRGGAGGGLVLGGFVLGGIGIAINPDASERAEMDAARYVFPPEDDHEEVKRVVARHNERVRERCSAGNLK